MITGKHFDRSISAEARPEAVCERLHLGDAKERAREGLVTRSRDTGPRILARFDGQGLRWVGRPAHAFLDAVLPTCSNSHGKARRSPGLIDAGIG